MKVLLINSSSLYVKQKAAIPLGLLSIATYLTNNGHTVKICDRAIDKCRINKLLTCFSPDIVGISAPASFDDAIKVSKAVKKRNIPVVWGGQITSLIPEIILKSGVVDYVVIGEGEITMLALINAINEKISFRDINGLAYIENGKIILNQDREFADLAELPIIDFNFVDPTKYWITNLNYKKMMFVYASKGCPFMCSYCYNSCLSKGVWRVRPPEQYLTEIKHLIEKYGMEGVYFTDDLLFANSEYLKNFCNMIIESGLTFVWSCNARADYCTKEDLQLMHDAGCRWIFFGIESGSEQRQKQLRKRVNLDKAKETIAYCKEIGIITTTSFMLGFVDETEEELKETIEYAKEINSDRKIAFKFKPIPKSELYYDLIKSGELKEPKTLKEIKNFTWMDALFHNYSKVPNKDLKVISSYFYYSLLKNDNKTNNVQNEDWNKVLVGLTLNILCRKTLKSLLLLIVSAKEFFEIIYYAKMFPKVCKKYNLTSKFNISNYTIILLFSCFEIVDFLF